MTMTTEDRTGATYRRGLGRSAFRILALAGIPGVSCRHHPPERAPSSAGATSLRDERTNRRNPGGFHAQAVAVVARGADIAVAVRRGMRRRRRLVLHLRWQRG